VWQGRALAFGETTEIVNAISNPLRFPGQYEDGETGLHYNFFRYFDTETGRYLTSDPIDIEGGRNTFIFAKINPLRFSDPSGLMPISFLWCKLFPKLCRGKNTGSCTLARHRELQNLVDAECKNKGKTRCDGTQNCQTLLKNLQINSRCAFARDMINRECFGGGDEGHRIQADARRRAAKKCADLALQKGCMCPRKL